MSKVTRSSSETEDVWGTEEDDMTEGDLGYGLGRRPGGLYEVSCSTTSKKRSEGKNLSPPPFPKKGEERSETVFQYSRNKGLRDACAHGCRASGSRRQSSTDSDSELSNEQLRQRLHETLEEVEILKTELEASQRQLEGKEEALKILQSMAVLDKATSHTQTVLQKTIEQKRSLEKRYLEALAMLDIKQQKMAQENMGQEDSGFTEVSGLESLEPACVTVLEGAPVLVPKWQHPLGNWFFSSDMRIGAGQAQGQARVLEILQKSKEEAHIMADAFRIAFEQQLMRKNDQALRLAHVDKWRRAAPRINRQPLEEDGYPSQRRKKTLGQRLLGILSENSSKKTEDQDNPQEVFKMLIDLLNDKEEALAHQRKVSYMLARALEDKDTAAKKNKDKIPTNHNFPFTTAWPGPSEGRALREPAHSHVRVSDPVGCICSAQHPQRDSDCSRTLKRSRSLPLFEGIILCLGFRRTVWSWELASREALRKRRGTPHSEALRKRQGHSTLGKVHPGAEASLKGVKFSLVYAENALIQQQMHSAVHHDTLLHGRTLFVALITDSDHIILPLFTQSINSNFCAHVLLIQNRSKLERNTVTNS
ncbi:hypothetical protein A6R68_04763 [Neotoma lepida]|uniref:Coiled-coil domain-containing protein 125 n=1 Tax=Neotoma lepida TaxID=56216 RepID=A0A1A6GKA4_NEOLE|nr:hypothetical protein A6R68_04763 [Neotoma lepida]